jgi:preprotein translocase subunit YajC
MYMNWLTLFLATITVLAFIVFFVKRNQKDKRDLTRELVKHDAVQSRKAQVTEVDPPLPPQSFRDE